MIRALVAVLILFATAASAQLLVTEQQPSQNGCQWAAQYQQYSSHNPGDGIPAATLLPANTKAEKDCPDSRAGSSQDVDKQGWRNAISDPTAFATLVIAVFTIVLAVSTIFLYRSTNKAAEAAMASAEAVMRIERPWVLLDKFFVRGAPFYRPASFWDTDESRNVVAKPPLVKFSWRNFGRGPAFLIAMEQKFFVMEKTGSLADHWKPSAKALNHEHPLIPDGTYGRPIHFSTGLIQQVTWQKIVSGDCFLVFAAFVRYRDTFGKDHETAFCAKFSALPKRPSLYQDFGGKEYNYQT